jgi:hypothetical protein
VGGVSGRAGAKAGGSNPSATDTNSFACRDGERHPGLLEGGALRGATSERGPRSVRRPPRVSSRSGGRADDSGCPKDAEEGNAVGMRHQAHAPGAGTSNRRRRTGDASFARSFDPCTLILTTLRRRKPRRWGARENIAVGQTCVSRKNRHRGSPERTSRGSPRVTTPARERRGTTKKRKEIEVSVPARIKSPGLVARTS